MIHKPKCVSHNSLETFRGHVQNTIPNSDIGWIRCAEVNGQPSEEVLFFHANYTKNGVLPRPGARVKGKVSRTADPAKQDRALEVEIDDEK